ncbi:hypothetical protein BH11PSE9_BH11PSE9_01560 [soil metagenome]
MPSRPRIEFQPVGNLGNQMLQLMLAEALQRRWPEVEVGGIHLPDWNLRRELTQPLGANRLRLIGQHVDLALTQKLMTRGILGELEFAALGFRMAHYLPGAAYGDLFPRGPADAPAGLADALLINVRGAEILADVHPSYGPIPVTFYRQLVAQTGLRPIFMGQVGQDPYSDALRAAFPEATMLASRGIMGDFELIRAARHVVVSVSTFSWLAAWLSDAQTIHLPVFGMFNPAQRPDIDLLPVDDARYRFYDFPVRQWNGSAEQFAALTAPADYPCFTQAQIRAVLQAANARLAPGVRSYRRRLIFRALLNRVAGVGGRVGLAW